MQYEAVGFRRPFFIGILLCVFAAPSAAEDVQASPRAAADLSSFVLPDLNGNDVSLGQFHDREAIVVCFLGTECPLAQFYGPRLQAMSDEFSDRGVAFVGVNANSQDSLEEVAAYAQKHGIKFPMLKDVQAKIAQYLGATRTPEVFLLGADGKVQYSGRVDKQFTFGSGVGLAAPQEKRADLKIAIEEVLAGDAVTVARTEPKGCLIGRPKEVVKAPTVTYSNQISRLIQDNCLHCHREGQIGPFAMETYEDVAGWGDMIAEVVQEQRMPPWHAGKKSTRTYKNETSLTDEEKQLIYQWVEQGCPEGDPADLPPRKEFTNDWFTKVEFDEVLRIAEHPVPVKAEGIEEYRYYEVPGVGHDRWVRLAECLPGNHQVVHHIIVYARPPGGPRIAPGTTGIDTQLFSWVVGYAPGTRPMELPVGWARLIPANYSLVFEMHYTPNGTSATDLSGMGLIYVDKEEVDRVALMDLAVNTEFTIPPHKPNFRVEAVREFERDTTVLAFSPHMHVRGKSFRYELVHPDKNSETVLDVPFYDFNWQNSYVLKEPMVVPSGAKFRAVAHFDNSESNVANPDPTKAVGWGPQSWNEMMIGFFEIGVSEKEARQRLEYQAKQLREEWAREESIEQKVSLN